MTGDDAATDNRPAPDGLQPERTALAWRRTGLALIAGSLAAVRVLPDVLGNWAVIPSAAGIALAVFIVATAQLRYRRVLTALRSQQPDIAPTYGGALPLLVSGLVVVGGIFALIGAVAAAVSRGWAYR